MDSATQACYFMFLTRDKNSGDKNKIRKEKKAQSESLIS